MMKKNDKNYNKKKVVIISCIFLVLVIMLLVLIPNIFKESKVNPKKDKEAEQVLQTNETSEDDTALVKKEKKELYLMDYEDLIDNQVTREDIFGVKPTDGAEVDDNSSEPGNDNQKTSQSKSNKGNKNSDDTNHVGNSNVKQNIVSDEDGVTVIDESPNTIKDESKQNEYKGEESQKPIEFFDVEPSGHVPTGDVPPSGEHVGSWN